MTIPLLLPNLYTGLEALGLGVHRPYEKTLLVNFELRGSKQLALQGSTWLYYQVVSTWWTDVTQTAVCGSVHV